MYRHLQMLADGMLRCAPSAPLTRIIVRGEPSVRRTALIGAVLADELSLALGVRATYRKHQVREKHLVLLFRLAQHPTIDSRVLVKLAKLGLASKPKEYPGQGIVMTIAIPAPGVLVH